MNKNDLISAIAERAVISKKDAAAALEATLASLTDAFKKGDSVALVGFGTFSVAHKEARKGINPATKAPIEIPASSTVKFKAGKALKESL